MGGPALGSYRSALAGVSAFAWARCLVRQGVKHRHRWRGLSLRADLVDTLALSASKGRNRLVHAILSPLNFRAKPRRQVGLLSGFVQA